MGKTYSDQEEIKKLKKRIRELEKSNKSLEEYYNLHESYRKGHQIVFFKFNINKGRFIHIDSHIKDLSGYTAEQIYNRVYQDISTEFSAEDVLKALSLHKKVKAEDVIGEFFSITLNKRINNGKNRLINYQFTINEENGCLHATGTMRPGEKHISNYNTEIERLLNQFILDSTPNLVYVIDSNGRFLMVNEAMSKIFEMDKEKLINRLNSDFIQQKDEIELLDKIGAKVIETNKPHKYTEKFTSPSGKRYWLQTIKAPLKIDNKTYILANSTDITERKKMEAELRNSENYMKSIINSTEDFIVLINRNGDVVMANESMAINLETSVERLISKKIYDLIPGPLENKNSNNFNLLIEQVITTCNSHRYQYISYDNRYYECVLYPVNEENELINRIVLNIRDISILKKAELESKNALEREKELNTLKSGIISTVSHEFRTPISVLQSNLQLLTKYKDKLSSEESESKQKMMMASIRHINYMLDNISILDKNYRGVLEFNPDYIDFEKLCTQIIEEIDSISEVKKRIMFNLHSHIGMVKMDEKLIRHILTNLLLNALKYSDDEKPVALITQAFSDNKIKIKIIDQGIGIKKTEIQNIWEPFFRGSNSQDFKGTGIGNSIVKSCVDLHKGSINLESEEGKGTMVTIIIPFEPAFKF